MMRYNRKKKEYVRPEVAEIILKGDVILLSVSSELGKDIYIDEDEDEQDDVVFG